jgi:predicted dehydrogenase
MLNRLFFLALLFITMTAMAQQKAKPFRIGIAGLTHSHVHWLLNRAHDGDIEIVGIAEPNRDLAQRLLKQYNLSMDLVHPTLDKMLEQCKPEAVTAFNSIYQHLEVVRACAPRKIHVMVEKPLAVSVEHAREMENLARTNNIQLLTNYETTWYASNYFTYNVFAEGSLGSIRKIVVHDGHRGPKEIGVNKEFLEWLTDPVQNGGGALMDFGCYGANLITWLMKGQRPSSIVAMTQQIKPHIYPKVDDEATIILKYDNAQCIIQASWNWPYNRKDMEVYGESGFVIADKDGYAIKRTPEANLEKAQPKKLNSPHHDPFAYLAAVVRGEITVKAFDLSSLENNMIVVEILEAAKEASKNGKAVQLK